MSLATIPKPVSEMRILSSFVGTNAIDRDDLIRKFGNGAAAVIERLVSKKQLMWLGTANGSEQHVTLKITTDGKEALVRAAAKTQN
ncbi:MAG: hypothetical protein KGH58_01170 [Candidatus Micrarchaeota archaeon]|nr:hypothetical protein [Candidatus Micrarchaeota archaeon]